MICDTNDEIIQKFKYSYDDKNVLNTGLITEKELNDKTKMPTLDLTIKLDSFKSQTQLLRKKDVLDLCAGAGGFGICLYFILMIFGKFFALKQFDASMASNLYYVKSEKDSIKSIENKAELSKAQKELYKST